jgi:hypothetical protein
MQVFASGCWFLNRFLIISYEAQRKVGASLIDFRTVADRKLASSPHGRVHGVSRNR